MEEETAEEVERVTIRRVFETIGNHNNTRDIDKMTGAADITAVTTRTTEATR